MKRKTNARKQAATRVPSEAQLAALRQSTTTRKQATVERLRKAIDALKAKKQQISVQTIYEECGLRYAAIHRNPEALALFRASSSHLVAQKKQSRCKRNADEETTPSARDALLSYKKPQLVARLRVVQQQLQEAQQQQAILVEASVKREARIAELEAKLAGLEPYRAFRRASPCEYASGGARSFRGPSLKPYSGKGRIRKHILIWDLAVARSLLQIRRL